MVLRGVVALGCSVMLLGLWAVSTAAGTAAVDRRWAWVTARQPTTASEYAPAGIDQGNSTGSGNTVQFMGGLGRYHVRFGGVGTAGSEGVVHVTALGGAETTCGIEHWGVDAGDVLVSIYCDDGSGQPTTSRFTATFLATNASSGRLAYLATTVADANSTPPATRRFNSRGGTNSVHHNVAPGDYTATLPGLGSERGDVQVTPIGTSPVTEAAGVAPAGTPPASACKTSWGPSGSALLVHIRCFDAAGIPTDTNFTLTFMQGLGLKGTERARVAYLLASRSSASSYTPSSAFSYSSAGGTPHVRRLGSGLYRVELQGMPKGGAAIVTATGSSARHCGVGSMRTDAAPQRVQVRCWDFSGNPADSKFTLAYER